MLFGITITSQITGLTWPQWAAWRVLLPLHSARLLPAPVESATHFENLCKQPFLYYNTTSC